MISFFIALIMYLILHFVFYSFREKIIKKYSNKYLKLLF
ncbi:hypothetical protein SeGA_2703 [Salmonella enterica subsp. enterica serovar Gaminara str. A4-567]|nr:hypothetical protein SeGA_2703 [Salmonella enterica subsp. enterica serovar Gaminara str. A4-567]